MANAGLPPIRTPLLDDNGFLTYIWVQWFLALEAKRGTSPVFLSGTHADRLNLSAGAYPDGSVFYENDRGLSYQVRLGAWAYLSGTMVGTLAQLPVGLTANDAGLPFEVSDYDHVLAWTGAGWKWADGSERSGRFELRLDAPNPVIGWHLCDGATVPRLNGDGTITNVPLPDWTTAAYLKVGNAAIPVPIAASGSSEAVSAGIPAGTIGNDNDAGSRAAAGVVTDPLVALNPHQHVFVGAALAAHSHGPGTLELRRAQLQGWYRQ